MRFVIPAKAGMQGLFVLDRRRIPANAGMTENGDPGANFLIS
jgi:hypothetical protein